MHKENQQATGGPTSLVVTSEARANPQLSSSMSAFNLNKPIYSASFIIHSESASENNASAVSTAQADLGKLAPNKTQSVSEGLKTILTQPIIRKRANFIVRQVEEDEASRTIKLEDLAKLVSKLTNQVLILQSQKHKLELEKNKAKAEVAILKAQPSFPNMGQLNELLTLDALLSLLNKVTNAMNQFAQAIASKNNGDTIVPSAIQVGTQPAEGEKNTNQATIS
nr:hypothetical protein [Tanacetum cinerariifolium]